MAMSKGAKVVVGAGIVGLIVTAIGLFARRKAGAAPPPEPPPEGMANLYGRVTDSQTGNGISGVKVTTTGAITMTDSAGNYAALDIPPGDWGVRFEKDGYGTTEPTLSIQEGNNELNVQLTPTGAPPTPEGIAVESVVLDKTGLVGGEKFVISITFVNPSGDDIWVQPKFAFGQITNGGFTAEKILAGQSYDPETGIYVDPGVAAEWADLGHPNHPGSDMPQFVYDPEGIPVLMAGGTCWLKVPAGGQATTSREWYITSKDFEYGQRDVCVKVDNPFYLVHDPGCSTRTVGGVTVVVNYRPVALDAFSGVVNDIAAIGLSPAAVTIDSFELQVDYSGRHFLMKVTITNNTGKTLINHPSEEIYTNLFIFPYAGETFRRLSKINDDGTKEYKTFHKGDSIASYLFTQFGSTGWVSIPPGTTTMSFSIGYGGSAGQVNIQYMQQSTHTNRLLPLDQAFPEGLKGCVHIAFKQFDYKGLQPVYGAKVDAGFKGIFSSQMVPWEPTPVVVGVGAYYQLYATFPEDC